MLWRASQCSVTKFDIRFIQEKPLYLKSVPILSFTVLLKISFVLWTFIYFFKWPFIDNVIHRYKFVASIFIPLVFFKALIEDSVHLTSSFHAIFSVILHTKIPLTLIWIFQFVEYINSQSCLTRCDVNIFKLLWEGHILLSSEKKGKCQMKEPFSVELRCSEKW